jgi:hypothetical protein
VPGGGAPPLSALPPGASLLARAQAAAALSTSAAAPSYANSYLASTLAASSGSPTSPALSAIYASLRVGAAKETAARAQDEKAAGAGRGEKAR